jgi:DNA-binding GntR family transcriptional regulator
MLTTEKPGTKRSKHLPLRQTAAIMVANELRRRIMTGALAGGAQLRQENLARELGVSRIPVREALKQLEAEGFVTLIAHKGAVVSVLSIEEISELFDLRSQLESWLLGLSIPRMEESALCQAEQALHAMIATTAIENWGALNWAFHRALYEASARKETLKILQLIHSRIDRYVRMQISLTTGQEKAHHEHRLILDYCRARDTARALRVLHQHIEDVKLALQDCLAGLGSDADLSKKTAIRRDLAEGSNRPDRRSTS